MTRAQLQNFLIVCLSLIAVVLTVVNGLASTTAIFVEPRQRSLASLEEQQPRSDSTVTLACDQSTVVLPRQASHLRLEFTGCKKNKSPTTASVTDDKVTEASILPLSKFEYTTEFLPMAILVNNRLVITWTDGTQSDVIFQ